MTMRLHRKVWVWYGAWWAVQLYVNRYVSLGVHLDWRRPVLDLHLGWFIVAVGVLPALTPAAEAQRHTCRGFLIDRPVL
jgi:hypothetical protein